jgi:hypothetical protein
MKRSHFLSLAILTLAGVAWADTGQPMADKVVGYWVSSSGTELNIAYSGDPQKALLTIGRKPAIDLWLAGGARGGISVDYQTPDGDKISGQYNEAKDTISVSNASGTFKGTWRRRR